MRRDPYNLDQRDIRCAHIIDLNCIERDIMLFNSIWLSAFHPLIPPPGASLKRSAAAYALPGCGAR